MLKNRCLRKLKNLNLDGVPPKQSFFDLVSLLELFPSIKTLSLQDNSYLNKTSVAEELHVLKNVEELVLDLSPLDISFLQNIGSLTSLKTLSLSNCGLTGSLPAQGT
ncbi:hypothetical protein PTKIN_Ptkin09bG0271100 [Pterospermum kingtungense]